MSSSFPQSAPLTYTLAALGGVLEVFATAILAYPDAREKQGIKVSPITQRLALMGNVVFQILASLSGNLFATWFGPVSLVGPIFFSAQLVANMIIFGFLLGLENLSKQMQVGTYVIVVSTILLPIVGPGIQEGQNAQYLLSKGYAIVWSLILLGGMLGSSIYVFSLLPCTKISNCKMYMKFIVLLVARSTCFTLNLTASRVFILQPGIALIVLSIIIKIVSGAIYTWAIVVQSTEVVQSKFVPLNATCLMLLNAITGIIIWQDWRVIESWTGYVCVFLLLALASYLLLSSAPLMTSENPEYGQKAHFRRQMMTRSFASRTFNQFDLGSLSESSLEGSSHNGEIHSCQSSEASDEGEGEASGDESEYKSGSDGGSGAGKQDKEEESDNDETFNAKEKEENNVSGNTHQVIEDEESQSKSDVEAPPTTSSRPRMERTMTKREAWQSIYHIHAPPKH